MDSGSGGGCEPTRLGRGRRRRGQCGSQRCREAALTGISGVPWGTPKGLEGPQRAAMRPTWRANGLRTANYRRMTALERVMRPDRRRDGAGWAAGGGTAASVGAAVGDRGRPGVSKVCLSTQRRSTPQPPGRLGRCDFTAAGQTAAAPSAPLRNGAQ